jgi:hypothetical protein
VGIARDFQRHVAARELGSPGLVGAVWSQGPSAGRHSYRDIFSGWRVLRPTLAKTHIGLRCGGRTLHVAFAHSLEVLLCEI